MVSKIAAVTVAILLGTLLFGVLGFLNRGAYWVDNEAASARQTLGAALSIALLATLVAGVTKLTRRDVSFWTAWLLVYTFAFLAVWMIGLLWSIGEGS